MRTQRDALSRLRFLVLIVLSGVAPGALFGGCTTDPTPTGCRTVRNCDDETPICDSTTLSCRKCSTNVATDETACANRSASTPHCGPAGQCIGCMGNGDCSDLKKPRCETSTHVCTSCLLATDCQSNICNADGSCAQSTAVLYVDNANGACSGTHTGTIGDPYCAIQEAVNDAAQSGKSLIAVRPSTTPYGAVIISSVTSAGLRLSSTTGLPGSVQIRANATDAISVTANGGKVVVSGFDLAATSGVGVNCSGADLTVTSSSIHHNANGIVANNCAVELDRLKVYKSDFNGISLNSTTGTTYKLNNLMIYANYYSGLTLSGMTGTMRFLTIYANGNPSLNQAPGLSCGGSNNTIEDSIVYKNVSQTNFDSQVAGCMGMMVVTDDSTGASYNAIVKSLIDFNNTMNSDLGLFDLGLKNSPANMDCCLDKIQPTTNLPDHDFFGKPRPAKSGTYDDIGAAEYQPQ